MQIRRTSKDFNIVQGPASNIYCIVTDKVFTFKPNTLDVLETHLSVFLEKGEVAYFVGGKKVEGLYIITDMLEECDMAAEPTENEIGLYYLNKTDHDIQFSGEIIKVFVFKQTVDKLTSDKNKVRYLTKNEMPGLIDLDLEKKNNLKSSNKNESKQYIKKKENTQSIPKGYWKTDKLYIATNTSVEVDKSELSQFPDGHFEVFVSYKEVNQNNGEK